MKKENILFYPMIRSPKSNDLTNSWSPRKRIKTREQRTQEEKFEAIVTITIIWVITYKLEILESQYNLVEKQRK